MKPEDILREVKRLFDANKTDEEIAAALSAKMGEKVSVKNVNGTRRLMGWLHERHPIENKSAVDLEFLAREFNERMPRDQEAQIEFCKEMAARMDVHYRSIRRALVKLELVEPRPMKPYPKEVWDRAEAMLKEGAPYGRVHRETGISTTTLSRKLPGYGLKDEDFGEYMSMLRLEKKLGLAA